jgi:hypothetical protein
VHSLTRPHWGFTGWVHLADPILNDIGPNVGCVMLKSEAFKVVNRVGCDVYVAFASRGG